MLLARFNQLLIRLATIAAACSFYAQSTLADSSEGNCSLKVGWGDWPPYQMQVAGKEPTGIQIKLLKQIAKQAQYDLDFVQQSFANNQQSIKDGTIDLTLDATVTLERKQFAHFSVPYRNEVLALYVREKFLKLCNQRSIDYLIKNGFRLGLNEENIYGKMIEKIQNHPQLKKALVYQPRNSLLFELLKNNQIDGIVEDPAVMAYVSRKDRTIGSLKSCKLTVKSSPVSLMFSKKTVPLKIVERFNNALAKIKQTDEYRATWVWY